MKRGREVVIVGAGPGGLAAAMLLAGAGLRVTVLERRGHVGGRTTTFEENGFRFDLGPTFFLYPQVLESIFRTVGRDLWSELELVRLDPQYRLVFGDGGELDCTSDAARMEAAVAALSPADSGAFGRFLSDNRHKFERFKPVLESHFSSWRDAFAPHLLRLLPLLKPWRSLDAELGKYFRDPRLRLAFSFQSKYLGMSPIKCPSLFSILSFLEYEHGVFHPIGGCGAVTECMARIAREMGVRIQLGEEARELKFEGRRVVGVRTDEQEYPADALVVNADFARAMTRLVPDRLRSRWTDRKLAAKKFSCSTFMLYLGLEGRSDQLAHHTIYLDRDYLRNLRDIEDDHVLSERPSFYVQNASITDPTLAQPGRSTLYVLVPVTHQHPNVDWSREKSRYRDLVLDRLSAIGLGDVRRRIRYERIVTPADWDSSYEIHKGATFNLSHTLGQMLHWRPRNRFEDLQSVYLVGGGTHPGSGLPVIFESARISTELLLRDLGLPASTARPEPVAA